MAYLSIIPPAEDTFEHNTLVSRVTPESIIHIVRPSSNVSEKIFFNDDERSEGRRDVTRRPREKNHAF